jgi:hypothetical protein
MESRWVRVVDTPGVTSFVCPAEPDRSVARVVVRAIAKAVVPSRRRP